MIHLKGCIEVQETPKYKIAIIIDAKKKMFLISVKLKRVKCKMKF